MGTNGATKVPISRGDVAEDSETTVEIKIKTLDSQTYTLRVNKCVPVPALKEQIATVTGVLSEQQRLICRGKVLKDDQLLSAYHVEDGHTLHLVVRQPHHSSSPSTSYVGSEGASGHPATTSASGSARGNQVARSFVFETVNVDQGDIDTSVLSRIISSMLDTIGTTSTGTGNTTNDHREMGSERLARASSDIGLPNSNPPQPNSTTTRVEFDRRQADFRFPSSVPMGPQNPLVIPDSLTTLYQYIGLMRDELRREGFADANGREHSNNAEAAGLHLNEGQSQDFQSHPSSAQGGLPSPASLAEILLSTRQLLMEQAGECLLQLARQLEDHTTVTDLPTRMNIQSSAMRSGVLMQNLGSLLLELGRTTMTLRMGQTPSEAVVNAGPANFISASGPNPMMVQPVPFYPGSNFSGMQMGTVNSGHNSLESEPTDAAILPRNIEIRIRTGRAVPVASANVGEQAGAPQPQGQTDPTRNSSGANVVHQALSAISGGESGVRVVPIRTVVAMPTGVNQSPSDSSGSSVRLFYPLLARIRQPSTGDASDARGSQASSQPNLGGPEIDHQPILESAEQRQNLESNGGAIGDDNRFPANTVPLVSGMSPPANESADYQESSRVFIPSQQRPPNNNRESGTQTNDGTTRDVESHEAAGVGSEQGLFFSSVLRQVIPLISQGREPGASPTNPSSSTAQTERENLNGSSSSQHCRDPPEAPSPKRPKRKSD